MRKTLTGEMPRDKQKSLKKKMTQQEDGALINWAGNNNETTSKHSLKITSHILARQIPHQLYVQNERAE